MTTLSGGKNAWSGPPEEGCGPDSIASYSGNLDRCHIVDLVLSKGFRLALDIFYSPCHYLRLRGKR